MLQYKTDRTRQAKWDKRNLRTVSTHVSREEAARFRRACRRTGTTAYAELRAFVLRVCANERMREIAEGYSPSADADEEG